MSRLTDAAEWQLWARADWKTTLHSIEDARGFVLVPPTVTLAMYIYEAGVQRKSGKRRYAKF